MDQNSNYITLEMNLKFQMKDYRLVLGVKKMWLLAVFAACTQLIATLLHHAH